MSSTERRRVIPWAVAGVLLVLLLLSLLWNCLHDCPCDAPSGLRGDGGSSSLGAGQSFTIAGSVTRPMTLGVWSPLDLSLTNTEDVEILVSTLHVTVGAVSAPQADAAHPCGVDDFAVRQPADSLDLSLGAGERATLSTLHLPASDWPQVRLLDRSSNQDGCKGSTLTLDYAGEGRQVG